MAIWTPILIALVGAIAGPLWEALRSRYKASVLAALSVASGSLTDTELYERLKPLSPATVNRALRRLVKQGRVIVVETARYALPEGSRRPGHRGWRVHLAPAIAGLVAGALVGIPAGRLVPAHSTGAEVSGPPLRAIFGQVGDGKAFVFKNDRGSLEASYTKEASCRRSSRPVGLRLAWNMDQGGRPSAGWGVHWVGSPSGSFEASRFSRLVVSVKGAKGGERFQIGLGDRYGHEVKLESEELVVVSATAWALLDVDLDGVAGIRRLALANINLGFNRSHGTGQVCIDEIAFV